MTTGNIKFAALQAAIENYLERFPRLTVKALSMRTGVPYATLRRIIQSEVNDIKDETIFRIIDRVLSKAEQMNYIRDHYPILSRMMSGQDAGDQAPEDATQQFKKFHRQNPHNLILRLTQSKAGTQRTDIERLTGEFGLMALDEMIGAGLLTEEHGVIEIGGNFSLELEDVRHQIGQDLAYVPNHFKTWPGLIHHVLGSVTAEGLQEIIRSSQNFLREVEQTLEARRGRIPVYFDIIVGAYDMERIPIRCHEDLDT